MKGTFSPVSSSIRWLHARKRRSEFRQGSKYSSRILGVCPDKEIEVFGSPRLGMDGDGIAADDKILNAVFVERGQEFFEVLAEHRVLVPSIDIASKKVRRQHLT
jgi:hypothetical protein